jgi:hypothetical protein
VSDQGPLNHFGTSAALAPPAATGLVSPGPAVLLAAGVVAAGPVEKGFDMRDGLVLLNPDNAIAAPAPVSVGSVDTYALIANTHFPRCARSVVLGFAATFAGTPGAPDQLHQTVTVRPSATPDRIARAHDGNYPITYGAAGSASMAFQCEIPVIAFATLSGEPDDGLTVAVNWGTTNVRTGQGASVVGWRL